MAPRIDPRAMLRRTMPAPISFTGFSNTAYSYAFADLQALGQLPSQGGNYVFAARVGGKPTIVFAGETDSLRRTVAAHPRWAEAQAKHAAVFILFHANDTPSRRRLEVHDLVRRHAPPMNAAE
jgi:hypothetical protein